VVEYVFGPAAAIWTRRHYCSPMTTQAAEKSVLAAVPTQLLIGGEWRDAGEGATLAVEDPATGETLVEVADATPSDAQDALRAAHEAFATFRDHPPRERADILRRAYDLVMERVDDLGLLMTLEMGKPLAESKAEVVYAANFLRWYSEEAVRINGRYTVNELGPGRVLTMKQPVGPCLFITPWNFPLAMGTRKIAPAIAAGCTCVVKPAKQTPLSMLMLARILEEAGLPGGVVNVLIASSSGPTMEPLIRDPRTRKLSFTGSTEVGRKLVEQSAEQVLRVSMELGGNAPFLVFDDADLDAAVEGAIMCKFRNSGQTCVSANRILVQDSVHDEFVSRFEAAVGRLVVGNGLEDGTQVGPLIDEGAVEKVERHVADATGSGAEVVRGGRRLEGTFFEPTVLTGVDGSMAMTREETFGPVAGIQRFAAEDEALRLANDTPYGLAAYFYSQNLGRVWRASEGLEYGILGVNTGIISTEVAPFGGMKESGIGREGSKYGLDDWLELKYVCLGV
jgi:succinate-semialdehyde dehydrogenase / glutarate-semialdehyde dehydrogenase